MRIMGDFAELTDGWREIQVLHAIRPFSIIGLIQPRFQPKRGFCKSRIAREPMMR
jgi:hypothetical protein